MYSVEYHTTHASTILLTRVGATRPLRPELPDGGPLVREHTSHLEPVPDGLRRHRPPLAELPGTLPPDEAIARAYRDYDYPARNEQLTRTPSAAPAAPVTNLTSTLPDC